MDDDEYDHLNDSLAEALTNWMNAPINDYGTPYVGIPEDFTPAEQKEFVELVRQPRFVSAIEQIALLETIVTRRK